MIFLNYMPKRIFVTFLSIVLLSFSSACGIWDPADARKTPVNADERAKRNLEQGKGFTLMGGRNNKTNYEFASSNPMWRATLEILDFLPLANVDYSGGIITTDWYTEGTASDESLKITIRFLTNEVRADGLKVIVHKKKCNIGQVCAISKIDSSLENELRVAILKKATIFEQQDIEKNTRKRPEIN